MGCDGIDAVQPHMQNTENSPIEEMEVSYPVSVVRYQLIPDSGGAGQYRGGLGLRRDYRFEGDVQLSVMADRVKFAPQGLDGGSPGSPCRFIVDPDGDPQELPSKFSIPVAAGSTVSVQIGGGGGFGPPRLRSKDAIAHDIGSGKISSEKAKTEYGYSPERDGSSGPGL